MCAMGSTPYTRSLGVNRRVSREISLITSKFACVSITPLGAPDVPEV